MYLGARYPHHIEDVEFTFSEHSNPTNEAATSLLDLATTPTDNNQQLYFSISTLLTGIGYTKTEIPFALCDVETPTNHFFRKKLDHINHVLDRLLESSLKRHLEACGNSKNIFVMSDACWNFKSKRNNSPMGTVTFIDVASFKVVGVAYFINISKAANFDGTAKAMEGAGTEEICSKVKEQGYTVQFFLHDGDSSSISTVMKYFPECQELLCINHAAKNLGKFVYEKVDKEYRLNIQGWFKRVAVESSKQPKEKAEAYFVDNLEIMLMHYSGIHDCCKHPDRSYSQKDAMVVIRAFLSLSTTWSVYTYPKMYVHLIYMDANYSKNLYFLCQRPFLIYLAKKQ